MEKHKKLIADNPKVVMVHFSLDDTVEDAADWASKDKFPWYTVFTPDDDPTGLADLGGEEVPEYLLLDATGAVVARGEADAFTMIAAIN